MAVATCLMLGVVPDVGAGVISVPGGYDVSYYMTLNSPTPTGNDIHSVFIFEWNNIDSSIDYSYTIAGIGRTDLSHVIEFVPTSALVLGYLDAVPGVGDGKRHLYMLADSAYVDQLVNDRLGVLFSQDFGVGEQYTIDLLAAAAAGNSVALNELSGLVVNEFEPASFDPAGGFKVLKWSPVAPPPGNSVPESATLALLTIGLAGLGWSQRKPA